MNSNPTSSPELDTTRRAVSAFRSTRLRPSNAQNTRTRPSEGQTARPLEGHTKNDRRKPLSVQRPNIKNIDTSSKINGKSR